MTSSLLWDDEVIKRSISVKINKLALSSKMALLVRIKRTNKIERSNLDLDKNYCNNLVQIKSVTTILFRTNYPVRIIRTKDSGRSCPHSWADWKTRILKSWFSIWDQVRLSLANTPFILTTKSTWIYDFIVVLKSLENLRNYLSIHFSHVKARWMLTHYANSINS